MAFELLKRGMNGLANFGNQVNDALHGKPGPKAALRGKTFEEGEKELAPEQQGETNKDKKDKKKPGNTDDRSFLEKVDDNVFHLGETFKTKAWTERAWRHVDRRLAGAGIEGLAKHYTWVFREFLTREHSVENLEAYLALQNRMAPEAFFDKFLAKDCESEINVPKIREIRELAAQGKHAQIDWKSIELTLVHNMSDTYSRAIFDDKFMTTLFRMVHQVEPPKTAHGYYDK